MDFWMLVFSHMLILIGWSWTSHRPSPKLHAMLDILIWPIWALERSIGQREHVWNVVLGGLFQGLEHLLFVGKLGYVRVFDLIGINSISLRGLYSYKIWCFWVAYTCIQTRGMRVDVRHDLDLVFFVHLQVGVHEQLNLRFHVFV